ncbi:MAG: OmpA family protein [Treponema sp.]|nr:OmpA family protein [Treponema sp.]MDY3754827.1 OmpA family protein [Treponema sp.]
MKRYYSSIVRRLFIGCLLSFSIILSLSAQSVSSESTVDWTNRTFTSTLNLDMKQANLSFPTGKNTASNRMNSQLPLLIKDPLLSLKVDSSYTLNDMIVNDLLSFDSITSIIETGTKSPAIFSQTGLALNMNHQMNLANIGILMIKHRYPYSPKEPIQQVASRKYTGIIIDARGSLPVQGEFVQDQVDPCFFPTVWDDDMNLLYEKNMTNAAIAQKEGIVHYDYSDDESRYQDRIGNDPLRIRARKVYGINRTDPIISRNDALKILSIPENIQLLNEGRVVILLDQERLIHPVATPSKDDAYYVVLRELKEFIYDDKVQDVEIRDDARGIQISVQNLQFVADSSELLAEEEPRLNELAEMLRTVVESQEYTVTVEGHTASVGKPTGELNLSIERALAIIQAMEKRGIDTSQFTYRGYGGTVPLGDNDTAEGRAMNRRVEIMIIPKQTYIQRSVDNPPTMQ